MRRPEEIPPPVIPSSRERKGPNKLLIALLAFFVAAALLTAFGLYWLFSAGEQVPSSIVIGPESTAYTHFAPASDDEGVPALANSVGVAIDRARRNRQLGANANKVMRYLERLEQGQGQPAYDAFVPKDFAFSFEPSGGGTQSGVVAVNFDGFGGLVKIMYKLLVASMNESGAGGSVIEHGQYEIVQTDEALFCLVGATIFLSEDLELLQRTLDRVAAGARMAPKPEMYTMSRLLARGHDLHAVLDAAGKEGVPAGLDMLFEVPLPMHEVQHIGLGMDVQSDQQARGKLLLQCAGVDGANLLTAALTEQKEVLVDLFESRGLGLSYESRLQGNTVYVDYTMTGLAGAVVAGMTNIID